MIDPIQQLNLWITEEHQAGAPNPQQGVLSTATTSAVPHARVVAIREINEDGLLFFTQKGTRKVAELTANPHGSFTFWFELLQREVIIEGLARPLPLSENERYWQNYPRDAQIRFYSYAPTSAQPIATKQILEEKRERLMLQYPGPLPLSEFYCGYRLKPQRMIFYSYRLDELSDVSEYQFINEVWCSSLLSP